MRKTKEEAKKTKEDILKASVHIFCEKGVSQSTLDEIAKKANVTRGAIYWHFKNKIEIFEALHEHLHRPFIDTILNDLEKQGENPLQQLRNLCVKLLTELANDTFKRQSLTLFMLKCNYSGELAKYKDTHLKKKKESMALFESFIKDIKKEGGLAKECDTALITLALSCYMKGILFEYLDHPDTFDIENKAPELIDLFFKNNVLVNYRP